MTTRENTWTERRPYPPEAREKYGASTPSLGAHEEHTDLVEASHVAAHSEGEVRARKVATTPPHAVGYGGIGELDDQAFVEAEWMFGLDPGTPPSARDEARESEGAAEDEDRGGAGESLAASDEDEDAADPGAGRRDEAEADDEDDDESARASHTPEGGGMRSTFPSLDHVSFPP